jgi:hypothetical protein
VNNRAACLKGIGGAYTADTRVPASSCSTIKNASFPARRRFRQFRAAWREWLAVVVRFQLFHGLGHRFLDHCRYRQTATQMPDRIAQALDELRVDANADRDSCQSIESSGKNANGRYGTLRTGVGR